jgi:hypothetical protein
VPPERPNLEKIEFRAEGVPSVGVGSVSNKAVGSAIAGLLILFAGIGDALAQAAPQRPSRPPAAARAGTAAPARTGECGQLPGGRAPVLKIAALTTGLSPRDLDLVYFGKPLADLTDEDFAQIAELSKRCGQGEGILPADKQEAFQSVVREAQQLRRVALDKVKRQMTDITTLPVARDKLIRLNGLSENLPLLESTVTRGDLKYTAAWITRQLQAVYDAAPKPEPPPPQMQATVPSGPEVPARTGRLRMSGGEEE